MTDCQMADRLTESDAAAFVNAREYPSGIWLGAPCRHLYADGLCRLTGELTPLGRAVRQILIDRAQKEKGE